MTEPISEDEKHKQGKQGRGLWKTLFIVFVGLPVLGVLTLVFVVILVSVVLDSEYQETTEEITAVQVSPSPAEEKKDSLSGFRALLAEAEVKKVSLEELCKLYQDNAFISRVYELKKIEVSGDVSKVDSNVSSYTFSGCHYGNTFNLRLYFKSNHLVPHYSVSCECTSYEYIGLIVQLRPGDAVTIQGRFQDIHAGSDCTVWLSNCSFELVK